MYGFQEISGFNVGLMGFKVQGLGLQGSGFWRPGLFVCWSRVYDIGDASRTQLLV